MSNYVVTKVRTDKKTGLYLYYEVEKVSDKTIINDSNNITITIPKDNILLSTKPLPSDNSYLQFLMEKGLHPCDAYVTRTSSNYELYLNEPLLVKYNTIHSFIDTGIIVAKILDGPIRIGGEYKYEILSNAIIPRGKRIHLYEGKFVISQ
jgi:hypothetical protein